MGNSHGSPFTVTAGAYFGSKAGYAETTFNCHLGVFVMSGLSRVNHILTLPLLVS